jgi:hypothetical protein
LTVYVLGPLTGGSLASLFFTTCIQPMMNKKNQISCGCRSSLLAGKKQKWKSYAITVGNVKTITGILRQYPEQFTRSQEHGLRLLI